VHIFGILKSLQCFVKFLESQKFWDPKNFTIFCKHFGIPEFWGPKMCTFLGSKKFTMFRQIFGIPEFLQYFVNILGSQNFGIPKNALLLYIP